VPHDVPAECVARGVEEQPDVSPNIVIAKAKIPNMRAGCVIIRVTLTRGIPTPYGMEP